MNTCKMLDQEEVQRIQAPRAISSSATTGPGSTAARACAASATTRWVSRRRPQSASTRSSPCMPTASARIAATWSTILKDQPIRAWMSLSEFKWAKLYCANPEHIMASEIKKNTLAASVKSCLNTHRIRFNWKRLHHYWIFKAHGFKINIFRNEKWVSSYLLVLSSWKWELI